MDIPSARQPQGPRAPARHGVSALLDRPLFWAILFCAYAAATSAIRLTHDATVLGDDAESLLWSRDLAWGYGVQPPLYTWLFWAVNQVVGFGVAANVVTRGLCHLAIYGATFVLARRFAPVRQAGLATLGIFLIQEISQTFLRTRTHNMLATAVAMLVVLSFLSMLDRRRTSNDVLFGLAVAIGILAKATLAVMPVALILAAMLSHRTRSALRPRGLALAAVVAAVVLVGPASWLLANFDTGTASLAKFQPGGEPAAGLLRLARGLADSFGPAAVMIAIGYAFTKGTIVLRDEVRLILCMAAVSVLIVAAGVFLAGATEIKERWLVPVLAPMVPVLVAPLLLRQGVMRYVPSAVGGLYALAMLALLPGYHTKSPKPAMEPYAALSQRLAEVQTDLILAPLNVAANVAISGPDLPVRARNAREAIACRGTVMLVVPVPDPVLRDEFIRQAASCAVSLREARRITGLPGRVAYDVEVLTLSPQS